jgi:prephenate dehydrogenase
VTDVGSVKRAIVARAEHLGLERRFAGSHPMAGTHERGFAASRGDLFRGAVVYVTPARDGAAAASEIAHFWESVLEARAVIIDAARHDHQLAATSHVPQIVASLLGHFLAARTPPGATLGPGARDTTRLAASNPDLWTEVLLLNRDEVLPALRALEEPLGALERALETGDARAVHDWLEHAAVWRRGFGA